MPSYRLVIDKKRFTLSVFGCSEANEMKSYGIAIGERQDGKARVYEEDFRTPEGRFEITAVHKRGSPELDLPNRVYYPFYLAHRFGSPFEDLGRNAYGDGIIVASYPSGKDIERYHELVQSGYVKNDWRAFMEEKWRAVFQHMTERSSTPLKKVVLADKRRTGARSFLEGRTFDELYETTPPAPSLPLAIHGTSDPACIGHKISGGCIRLRNEDILELTGFITPGDAVEIS